MDSQMCPFWLSIGNKEEVIQCPWDIQKDEDYLKGFKCGYQEADKRLHDRTVPEVRGEKWQVRRQEGPLEVQATAGYSLGVGKWWTEQRRAD